MRRAIVAGLALAMLVCASGCSTDEPRPRIADPSDSSASTPAKTPSQSTTTLAESAGTAVRSWIDEWNHLQATGDAGPVRTLSSEACQTCRNLIEPIAGVYENGGFIQTTGWSIDGLAKTQQTDGISKFQVAVDLGNGETQLKAGEEVSGFESRKEVFEFTTQNLQGAWTVDRIVALR